MSTYISYIGAWATIVRTENGWAIYGPDPDTEGHTLMSVAEDEKTRGLGEPMEYGDVRSLQSAFFRIIEFLDAWGGRYDAERIRVNIEPGDKYEVPKGGTNDAGDESARQG